MNDGSNLTLSDVYSKDIASGRKMFNDSFILKIFCSEEKVLTVTPSTTAISETVGYELINTDGDTIGSYVLDLITAGGSTSTQTLPSSSGLLINGQAIPRNLRFIPDTDYKVTTTGNGALKTLDLIMNIAGFIYKHDPSKKNAYNCSGNTTFTVSHI